MIAPYHQSGGVTIYHGEALDILAQLPAGSVDYVLTDPPYSSGGQFRGDRTQRTGDKYQQSDAVRLADFTGDNRDQRSFGYWCTLWLDQCRTLTKSGGLLSVFTDWRQLPTTTDVVQAGGWVWRGIAVWGKPSARPQSGRFTAQTEFIVWATNGPREIAGPTAPGVFMCQPPKDRVHQTQKPESVVSWLLTFAAPGDVILDPFMGSGTTLRAAREMGCQVIGIEREEQWCEYAAIRCAEDVLDFGSPA